MFLSRIVALTDMSLQIWCLTRPVSPCLQCDLTCSSMSVIWPEDSPYVCYLTRHISPALLSDLKYPALLSDQNCPGLLSDQYCPGLLSGQNCPDLLSGQNCQGLLSDQNCPGLLSGTRNKPDIHFLSGQQASRTPGATKLRIKRALRRASDL